MGCGSSDGYTTRSRKQASMSRKRGLADELAGAKLVIRDQAARIAELEGRVIGLENSGAITHKEHHDWNVAMSNAVTSAGPAIGLLKSLVDELRLTGSDGRWSDYLDNLLFEAKDYIRRIEREETPGADG